MKKAKWWIVGSLTLAGVCFLAFSLCKKRAIAKAAQSDNGTGGLYNLEQLSAAELDTLKTTNEYWYLIHRGVYFSENGKPDSAVLVFRKAIKLKPQAAFVSCQLGKAFMQTAQYDSALYYFDKAIKLKPDYRIARHYKDIAIHRKGGEEDFGG